MSSFIPWHTLLSSYILTKVGFLLNNFYFCSFRSYTSANISPIQRKKNKEENNILSTHLSMKYLVECLYFNKFANIFPIQRSKDREWHSTLPAHISMKGAILPLCCSVILNWTLTINVNYIQCTRSSLIQNETLNNKVMQCASLNPSKIATAVNINHFQSASNSLS